MTLAVVFAVLLGILIVFQLALALGAPWGRFAWGGQHPGVLPLGYRVGSAVSVLVYVVIGLLALDLAGAVDVVPNGVSQVGMWVVSAFLVLGVLMNAISRSRAERFTMTPAALVLAVLALLIAFAGPAHRSFEGLVLDAEATEFCETVLESYPPQCGRDALAVVGWNWDATEHEQSSSIRWGMYRFSGVLDGGTITVTGEPRPLG